MSQALIVEAVSIAATGGIVWLLLCWKQRPKTCGKMIMLPAGICGIVGMWFSRQMAERLAGWLCLLGAIGFAVAYSINVTFEQKPEVMAKKTGLDIFNRGHARGAIGGGAAFLALGIGFSRWVLVAAGGGMVLGIALALVWEKSHRPKAKPVAYPSQSLK
jgi:hypothetical protein